jgi:predicted aspartyl protease
MLLEPRLSGHIVFIACLLAIASFPAIAQDAASLGYADWFAVQHAQGEGKRLSPLGKGELDASEDHRSLAEAELNAVIKAAPQGDVAYEAHSTLSHFYLRIGRFHDAETQIQAMLVARPTALDLANVHSLFRLLSSHPDLTVPRAGAAIIHTHVIEGNIFAPVTVNGTATSYMLDTGLDLSVMSETEAARLGLQSESSTTRMNDISGLRGSELKIVVVNNLIIGVTHLNHVPFLVVADTNGAFSGIPSGQHGILGIQPLLALGRLTFKPDGTLTIAGETEPAISTVPVLFAGTTPLTQIRYRNKPLTVTLDTGATQTTLNPPFAQLFPDIVQSGKNQSHEMNGLSGTTAQQSVSVPHLTLLFGRDVELTPATILLNQTTGASAWSAANLGYDLIQQAVPFTLDFHRMTIEFLASH